MWVKFRDYLTNQLRQSSTWRGIILVAGSGTGLAAPENAQNLLLLSVLIAGAIGALFPDKVGRGD